MASNIADIAALILARKQQLDRVLRPDLVKFQVRYGDRALTEALKIVGQAELDNRLSVSGEQLRRAKKRQNIKETQRLFARRGE